jgi:hypothetical protein
LRYGILIFCLAPFLWYAARDNVFHFRGRRVSRTEHFLHLGIGVTLAVAITHAFLGNQEDMLVGFLLFVVAGAIDEYVYHRGIPSEESDLHAKEHLALLIFIVASMAVNWLELHDWQIRQVFQDGV